MKKLLFSLALKIRNICRDIYVFIFCRPIGQKINKQILLFALHAKGYENYPKTGEEKFLKYLSTLGPKFCVDIGANIGVFSEWLLKHTKSDVISFEPLPQCYEILLNLKERYPDRFEPFNIGIGSEETELDLYFGTDKSELASFTPESHKIQYINNENVHVIKAKINRLDHFFQTHPKYNNREIDLLKIDTEGFELEVLLGASWVIENCKPRFILMEHNVHHLFRYHPLQLIGSHLKEYKAFQILRFGSGLYPIDINDYTSNIFNYSNFVFIHKDCVEDLHI